MTHDKKSRQTKLYVAILAIALGGLVVDRVILEGGATGPDVVEANNQSPAVTTTTQAAGSSVKPTTRANTLAGRLDRKSQHQQFDLFDVEDAFTAPKSWVAPKPLATPPVAKLNVTEAFAQKHKLLAVINNTQGGAAIINNQTVMLGREIDGFKLIEVTKRTAILTKDDHRVELSLPSPKGSISSNTGD